MKKAVLVGINYTKTQNELSGCINDTYNLKIFLINNKYFKEEEIILMNDLQTGDLYPSKANILKQMDNLVTFSNNNKQNTVRLFFAYSGHGSNVPDTNGDEADKMDEVLVPIDFNKSGFIVDDEIKSRLIDKLDINANLVMLSDSCYSGSVCDLKYNYKCDPLNSIITNKTVDSKCNCVFVSGCRDDQTSADAYLPGLLKYPNVGAMTTSFIANYYDGIKYKELIIKMRAWLIAKKFVQVPQLSSGKPVNLDAMFLLSVYDNVL